MSLNLNLNISLCVDNSNNYEKLGILDYLVIGIVAILIVVAILYFLLKIFGKVIILSLSLSLLSIICFPQLHHWHLVSCHDSAMDSLCMRVFDCIFD